MLDLLETITLITIYVVTTRVMKTIRACLLARALNYLNCVFSIVHWVSIEEYILRNA